MFDEPICLDNVTFEELNPGCCRGTHVEPFSADLHLFGFECKDDGWAFVGVLILIIAIKLFQSKLYTIIGRTQRELMQMEIKKRWSKIGWLVLLEFIAGVMGIASIIVITGANVAIWITIVLTNCLGIVYSFGTTAPDHHSVATDIINMAKKFRDMQSKKDLTDEDKEVQKAVNELKQLLGSPSSVEAEPLSEEQPLIGLKWF